MWPYADPTQQDTRCPRCFRPADPGNRFCGRCGARLPEGGMDAVAEERRTVSVLFVDIVGFTAVANHLDPEQIRAIQHEYFRVIGQIVGRWNGAIEKYIGDAAMAVFGVPRSDEYDAYRAVRAGLQLQEALRGRRFFGGQTVQARVGVATGEELVDLTGGGDASRARVCGRVVTTAARVQRYTSSGTVAVTEITRDATAALVQYQELPPVILAGHEPLRIWQACRTIGRGVDLAGPVRTPALVG